MGSLNPYDQCFIIKSVMITYVREKPIYILKDKFSKENICNEISSFIEIIDFPSKLLFIPSKQKFVID